jgi:hypothetical protein
VEGDTTVESRAGCTQARPGDRSSVESQAAREEWAALRNSSRGAFTENPGSGEMSIADRLFDPRSKFDCVGREFPIHALWVQHVRFELIENSFG